MKYRCSAFLVLLLCGLFISNRGDARSIAFTSDRTGNLDIYIVDTSGENLSNLTDHPAADYSPTWSPAGDAIAFVSERDGNPEIYVIDLNTQVLRRLTEHAATDLDPAWSPDGRTIAFASNQAREHAADTDIYTMDVNGRKVTRLTSKGGNNSTPAWSPDSEWIAFRSTHDGIGGIHIMTAEGEKQEAVTQVAAMHPSWAPNGEQLCIASADLDGVAALTLFLIDVDGENSQRLTDGVHVSGEPSWSPDGRSIVYASEREGHKGLYRISVAGGEPQPLIEAAGEDSLPAWSPVTFSVAPRPDMQRVSWGFLKYFDFFAK